MLKSSKMIGFVLTKDSKQSRRFYEETFDFKFKSEDQFALVMETNENMIRISPVKDFVPAHCWLNGLRRAKTSVLKYIT